MPAPLMPTLSTPASGSYFDVAAHNVPFSGVYHDGGSGPLTSMALRISQDGGDYKWWNGSSLVATETYISASILGATVTAGILTDGSSYSWSMSAQDAGGNSPYAADYQFFGAVVPSVTVTAPTGTVSTLGPSASWTNSLSVGASQIAFHAIYYTDAENSDAFFAPGMPPDDPARDSGTVASPATTWNPGSGLVLPAGIYWVYVQVTQTGGAPSAWAFHSFTMAPGPAIPTLTATLLEDGTTGEPYVLLHATSTALQIVIYRQTVTQTSPVKLIQANAVSGALNYTDRTMPLGQPSQYTARALDSTGTSASTASVSITPLGQCILSDPKDSSVVIFFNRFATGSATGAQASFEIDTHEPLGTFYGWGNPNPTFQRGIARSPTLTLAAVIQGYAQMHQMQNLLGRQKMSNGQWRRHTLLLRTDMGDSWYVVVGPDVAISPLRAGDRTTNPWYVVNLNCTVTSAP
jgi:hypothetical protein